MRTLRDIFDELDLQRIREELTTDRSESLHLEFKTLSESRFAKEDLKTLSKTLSAFLNSDGGILILGVNCRRDGAQEVKELQAISDLRTAYDRLQSLLSEAISPIHDGIQTKQIPTEHGSGLIAIFAPASDIAPHMARGGGEGRYYKRSGSSSVPMEHFDLEDMFGRRPRPKLALEIEVVRGGHSSGGGGRPRHDIETIFAIANEGRGVARYPLLALEIADPHGLCTYGLDGNGNLGLPQRRLGSAASRCRIFAGGADDVVHGSTSIQVCKSRVALAVGCESATPLRFTFRIGADGSKVISGTGVVEEDDFLDVLGSGRPRVLRFPQA
ncbi:MAG: ATP-binding protein [Planctomycetes bacterium]|nr:ATP-binding protein [Planctomycetota bacterium]